MKASSENPMVKPLDVRLRCDPVIGSNVHTGDRKPTQTRVIFQGPVKVA